MSHTPTYTIQDFGPSDLMTSEIIGRRRLKVSAESALSSAILNGAAYSITGSVSVPAGETLSLNISLAAPSVIRSVSTISSLFVSLFNQHSTGTADGIFPSVNLNLLSNDVSPSQGQLFESSTPQGEFLNIGKGEFSPGVVAGYSNQLSAVVENTGITQTVFISVIIEEIGPREPLFGLTPTTDLQPNTEMSTYG